MDKGLHPLDQGFDYWFGTKGSNDWDGPGFNYEHFRDTPEEGWKTPLYRDRETLGICPQSQFTRRYTEETIRLIKENKDKPFFIYLAHNMPHVPIFASEEFKGKSRNGVYGDAPVGTDGVKITGGAEGGSTYRCRTDGRQLARQSTGHWNAFGMAYDLNGNLFSTDNDPNAIPPNRLLHIVPGADFGFEYRYGRSGLHPLVCWYGEAVLSGSWQRSPAVSRAESCNRVGSSRSVTH